MSTSWTPQCEHSSLPPPTLRPPAGGLCRMPTVCCAGWEPSEFEMDFDLPVENTCIRRVATCPICWRRWTSGWQGGQTRWQLLPSQLKEHTSIRTPWSSRIQGNSPKWCPLSSPSRRPGGQDLDSCRNSAKRASGAAERRQRNPSFQSSLRQGKWALLEASRDFWISDYTFDFIAFLAYYIFIVLAFIVDSSRLFYCLLPAPILLFIIRCSPILLFDAHAYLLPVSCASLSIIILHPISKEIINFNVVQLCSFNAKVFLVLDFKIFRVKISPYQHSHFLKKLAGTVSDSGNILHSC